MGVGVAIRRARLFDDAAAKGVVNVLLLVVTPCLIVDVFQRPFDAGMLRQLGIAFVVAVLAHVAAILVSRFTARSDDPAKEPVLVLATVFSNAGFMGIPLEYAILGERGVFFGIVYVAVFNLVIWSWGLWRVRNDEITHASPLTSHSSLLSSHLFFNPGTVGLALGLPLFLFSCRLPQIFAEPVHMLAAMNTPLAMLVIGYYLGGAHLRRVACDPRAHAAAFVRLVVHPLLVLAALVPFRGVFDRSMSLAMVIASASPVAAMVTMFAAKYGRDTDLSVGLVSGTALLSVLSLPAVITIALAVL